MEELCGRITAVRSAHWRERCRSRGSCLLRPRDYGQKDARVDHIHEVWNQAAEARRRAADAIERSAALADDHARRAEADGDHGLARRERAHARQARQAVAEMRQ